MNWLIIAPIIGILLIFIGAANEWIPVAVGGLLLILIAHFPQYLRPRNNGTSRPRWPG